MALESSSSSQSSLLFSSSSECSTDSSLTRGKRKSSRLTYNPEWKDRFFMWPADHPDSPARTQDDEMICMLCNEKMKAKCSTAARHQDRKHSSSKTFTQGKRLRVVKLFEANLKKQQATIMRATEPQYLAKVAPYKLAFVINKHKMPFNSCQAFTEFASNADPNSSVFSRMPSSRETVTRRTRDIHQNVLRPDLVEELKKALYWGLIIDESTDCATKQQMGLYVRYVNLDQRCITEAFLEMKQIMGHPTAVVLFDAVMHVLTPEDTNLRLPTDRLASLTCDGAPVVLSQKNGVAAKLKASLNPNLFITHCPPHRLVLASKAGQKIIPDNVERLIGDVLYFFKDSPVRREEFRKLKELVEPDSPHVSLVLYHKVRWLSLADCVDRLTDLLPLLVRFFEEQSQDRANSVHVRSKSQSLYERLSEPLFQFYLYFLGPQLGILATLNKWLQHSNITLHVVYCKIDAVIKAFIQPVVRDINGDPADPDNHLPLDQAISNLPGSDFQKHLLDCSEHALVTETDLNRAKENMVSYIYTIASSLKSRFPEMGFVIKNTSFLDPSLRQLHKVDIPSLVDRFSSHRDPFEFDTSVIATQYSMYCNDSSLDFAYEVCSKDHVRFWCELYEAEDYRALASLAILLLSISPTSVICERGFSSMNYIKNEFRSVLTQENLNACMAISLCKYNIDTFPFSRCLQ